jgi:hypothetical protein
VTVDAAVSSLIIGVRCTHGHFNDPKVPYCSVCGISMIQLTRVPVPAPRPPLGVLTLDDGSVYPFRRPSILALAGRHNSGRRDSTGPADAVLDGEPRSRGNVDHRFAFVGTAVEAIAGAGAGPRRGTHCVPAGLQVVEDHVSSEAADLRQPGAIAGLQHDLGHCALDPEVVARPADERVDDGQRVLRRGSR